MVRQIFSLSGCLILAGAAAQQQNQPLRLSVTTRLVQVSVIVQDSRGNAVADLTKDDFEVTDNGKRQSIAAFVRSAGERLPAPAVARDPREPRTWTNRGLPAAETPRTVTALVFDGLNTNLKDQEFARQKVVAFLRQLRPGDSAALYLIAEELHVLHDFSDDAQSLARVFEDYDAKVLSQWARERSPAAFRGRLKHDRALFTLASLRAIGQHLSRIPGRKNLVWVTSGFPLLLMERERRTAGYIANLIPDVEATARAIGDADVALYPVSAMGLVGVPQMSAAQGSTRSFSRVRARPTGPEITNSRQAGPFEVMMETFAEQTGGRAFVERNDLDVALRQTVHDLTTTYTLAFHPNHDEWNGAYRHIKVQVKRKGLKARHRPGYVASADLPAGAGQSAQDTLMDAISSPLDSTGLGLTVTPAEGAGALRIRLDAAGVTLEPVQQDRRKGAVLVAVVPLNESGEMGDPQVQRAELDLTNQRFLEVVKEGMTFIKTVPPEQLARGVRVFVMDLPSQRVGSVNVR